MQRPDPTERTLPAIVSGNQNAPASIIWLHGLGADGNDFAPIVPELGLGPHQAKFIFPHAPIRPVTLNMGMRMRAWYDITSLERRGDDEVGVRASAAAIEALIAQEEQRGVSSEKIVLAGFSQGAALAMHVALRYPRRLAGLIALSGYLLLEQQTAMERQESSRGMKAFIGHGRHDQIVPLRGGMRGRELLTEWGLEVEWHDYPMEHSVHAREIQDIATWLERALGLGRPD